jgi:hypothetical protein
MYRLKSSLSKSCSYSFLERESRERTDEYHNDRQSGN